LRRLSSQGLLPRSYEHQEHQRPSGTEKAEAGSAEKAAAQAEANGAARLAEAQDPEKGSGHCHAQSLGFSPRREDSGTRFH